MALRLRLSAPGAKATQGALVGTGVAARGAAGGLATMGAAAAAASGPLIVVTAAVAAFVLAAKFIKDAIDLAVGFEDVMVRTQAVTKASAKDMTVLEKEVRDLGATTRFTATEVANAAQIMAIAGISIDEMVSDKALESMLQLALVGGVDVPTAAGIAVAAIRGFRLEMNQLEMVNDVLAVTLTSTNVTLTQLGEGLKYVAPTAAAAGLEIVELSAAIGILGNAGLQGSLAGTQLRGALMKLIKPSEAARRVIGDLGLDVYRLTPAGEAANTALTSVIADLDRTKRAGASVTAELKAVTNAMRGMSLDQQRNNLAIMKIRRRAEKEGRSLTGDEIEAITRLESKNKDLDISMAESSIKKTEASIESDKLKESESALSSEFTSLNNLVNSQIMGITSLVDVINQLSEAGATTAQMMEIFGIRGGGAILALTGQTEGFKQLITDLENSEGAAQEMADTIGGTTETALLEMKSAWAEVMISIGQEFLPMMKDDIIPMLRDDLIPLFKILIPILKFMLLLIKPLVRALTLFFDAGEAISSGNLVGGIGMIAEAFANLLIYINPVYRVLNAIVEMMGMEGGIIGGVKNAFSDVGDFLGFAEGGIVSKPTMAMVGERGPEMIIPLRKMEAFFADITGDAARSRQAVGTEGSNSGGGGVTIQNLSITGMKDSKDVEAAITKFLPAALSRGLAANVRGSF